MTPLREWEIPFYISLVIFCWNYYKGIITERGEHYGSRIQKPQKVRIGNRKDC